MGILATQLRAPSHNRSYDNECVVICTMLLTFFLFVHAVKTGSSRLGTRCGSCPSSPTTRPPPTHLIPRPQHGVAYDLLEDGGVGRWQGRATPPRPRRRQACMEGHGPLVEDGAPPFLTTAAAVADDES